MLHACERMKHVLVVYSYPDPKLSYRRRIPLLSDVREYYDFTASGRGGQSSDREYDLDPSFPKSHIRPGCIPMTGGPPSYKASLSIPRGWPHKRGTALYTYVSPIR